ncbi:MAG: aminotransferase class III-fold pyridoxal phosphate-dependent enzyme [Alphaproteobacteria bacterium]
MSKAAIQNTSPAEYDFTLAPNSLDEFWMPFTNQRGWKKNPRMLVKAEGMYYTDTTGRQVLDGAAGLWCVNAGHGVQKIKDAVNAQMDAMDFCSNFRYGSPAAFRAASRVVSMMPEGISNVFFSNSGSEAVDTALKIALAYHRENGQGSRRLFIGRERAYHGVGFGGISVGGIPYNRAAFGQLLPNVDHMRTTYNFKRDGITKGQPEKGGVELANELEELIYMHDASNVAAVIVEPIACSTGVLPPPKGYLERLREICTEHGILLIFDEVVTAFGRLGCASAAEYFDILPDMITSAKALTNGAMPMAATFVAKHVYDTMMDAPEEQIELFHGYTYSGHPVAAAAAIATMDEYQEKKIFENAKKMMPVWEDAIHSLAEKPHVKDIRNMGILAGIELHPDKDGYEQGTKFFNDMWEKGLTLRPGASGCVALSPPLILNENHIDQIVTIIGDYLDSL